MANDLDAVLVLIFGIVGGFSGLLCLLAALEPKSLTVPDVHLVRNDDSVDERHRPALSA